MKHEGLPDRRRAGGGMPPTRGHDLKRAVVVMGSVALKEMPPTRGHDLKRRCWHFQVCQWPDAPHTGARLET